MSAHDLAEQHGLLPHPFEGYAREISSSPGAHRTYLQALGATDEAGWHKIDAATRYVLEEGGPLVISISPDDIHAASHRLMAPGHRLDLAPGCARTLSCLGVSVLFRVSLTPDIALTERILMPDDWFPPGGAAPRTTT